jgi:ATP-binding cassette subfamily B (MDR/TAP) protein 1
MLTDDLLKMKEGIGDKVADFLSLLARMIGCLVFAFVKGWKLTLVILSAAPIVILVFNLTIKFSIKYAKEQIEEYAKANTIVEEVLTAIRTVTAFNGQKKEQDRFNIYSFLIDLIDFFFSSDMNLVCQKYHRLE